MINSNVEELANAVVFALKHPELGADMVKSGQWDVRENLNWDKYARDMFRSVLCSEYR